MSAALQLPLVWASHQTSLPLQPQLVASAVHHIHRLAPPPPGAEPAQEPIITWAFYRKHTEQMLRRYLYASVQIGRAPNLLGDSVGRGWVSSRRVRTFEDALIFVLDIERCLKRLDALDAQIITRVILQEYTQVEAAPIIGISVRTVCNRLPQALDHLTEHLVAANLLTMTD